MKSGKTGPLFVRSAGIIAWLSTGIPAMLLLLQTPALLGPVRLWLWFGAFLVFGLGFWHTSRMAGEARLDRSTAVWLGLQATTALGMLEMICTGFESVLLVVVAAQLGLLLPFRPGFVWIVIQTALIGWFSTHHWAAYNAFRWTAATFGFELFAFVLAAMTRRGQTLMRSWPERTPSCGRPNNCLRRVAAWPSGCALRANCTMSWGTL